MQRSTTQHITRASKPVMSLCLLALLAACTSPSSDAQATSTADKTGSVAADASTAPPACAAATNASPVQAMVCKDPALARLDTDLAKASATARDTLDAAGKAKLQSEQEHWQQHTRDLCADAQCLKQVYADRIQIMSATRTALADQASCVAVEGQKDCVDVMKLRDANSQLANFNTLMGQNSQKGTLIGCTAATNLSAGTAGGNDLFAANCTLQSAAGKSNVQVCSNQMIGNFVVEPAPAAYGDRAVAQLVAFTQQHCAG
ncbi:MULTISPECIES: hypothetical protein [unclassified Xanthomonas]|uniref:hypothetical protein n=1 Tax=unclassified Xanthomonas TaxID=2643310 RepID=UPI002B23B0D7|nr:MULTISPECIES: hypothetical protein [unclassified Xanthomonas]MEA9564336.1 hypothetical protein [Xanthomonas sp. WHRI 8932A]MEA9636108.1 hypothetical protein [Xanthomonas sp. WHRI 8812E]